MRNWLYITPLRVEDLTPGPHIKGRRALVAVYSISLMVWYGMVFEVRKLNISPFYNLRFNKRGSIQRAASAEDNIPQLSISPSINISQFLQHSLISWSRPYTLPFSSCILMAIIINELTIAIIMIQQTDHRLLSSSSYIPSAIIIIIIIIAIAILTTAALYSDGADRQALPSPPCRTVS